MTDTKKVVHLLWTSPESDDSHYQREITIWWFLWILPIFKREKKIQEIRIGDTADKKIKSLTLLARDIVNHVQDGNEVYCVLRDYDYRYDKFFIESAGDILQKAIQAFLYNEAGMERLKIKAIEYQKTGDCMITLRVLLK